MKETTKKTTKPTAKKAATKKITKTTKPEVVEVVETSTPATKTTIPTWAIIAGLAVVALIYAYVRFWNIAVVNGTPISRLAHYKAMQQQVGEQTLDNMITEALIFDAAETQNYVVDEKIIDEKIATISAQVESQGKTLEQTLADENITLPEVRRQFALQQIVEVLGQGQAEVTDAEIDKYLADNQETLPTSMEATELRQMVKAQLENQKSSDNITTWLANLKTNAKITR